MCNSCLKAVSKSAIKCFRRGVENRKPLPAPYPEHLRPVDDRMRTVPDRGLRDKRPTHAARRSISEQTSEGRGASQDILPPRGSPAREEKRMRVASMLNQRLALNPPLGHVLARTRAFPATPR